MNTKWSQIIPYKKIHNVVMNSVSSKQPEVRVVNGSVWVPELCQTASLRRNLVALSRQLTRRGATDDSVSLTGRHCLILCVLLVSQLLLNYVFTWARSSGRSLPQALIRHQVPPKSTDYNQQMRDLRSVFRGATLALSFLWEGGSMDNKAITTATTCQSSAERSSTP